MGRVIAAGVGGVLAALVLLVAAATGAVSGVMGGGGSGGVMCVPVTPAGVPVAGLSGDQWRNATTVVQTGQSMSVPAYGWVVAIATALQESDLINLGDLGANNDHDSVGLFQQRPSMGWGAVEQIMNPVYASRKFFEALSRVDGWQTMTVTVAAQHIQKSAFPEAYSKHEGRAREIVGALGGSCVPIRGGAWVSPVHAAIVSEFRTAERPDHHGADLGAGRGTPIMAASSGVVLTVICNIGGNNYAPGYRPSPCDVDGSVNTGGCGWMVEVKSFDLLSKSDVVVRSCHMLRMPLVHVGQIVRAGEVIGIVGTSGNSSGPHLHFEIHLVGDSIATPSNAVSPTDFYRARGLTLGQ